jgi:hypothetical protein
MLFDSKSVVYHNTKISLPTICKCRNHQIAQAGHSCMCFLSVSFLLQFGWIVTSMDDNLFMCF